MKFNSQSYCLPQLLEQLYQTDLKEEEDRG